MSLLFNGDSGALSTSDVVVSAEWDAGGEVGVTIRPFCLETILTKKDLNGRGMIGTKGSGVRRFVCQEHGRWNREEVGGTGTGGG